MRTLCALATLALANCATAPPAPTPITYAFSPGIEDGALSRLHVALTFTGDADGETELALPVSGMAEGEAADYVQAFAVQGASVREAGVGRYALTHAPNAALSVRYDLISGYPGDPQQQPFRPVVRPDWFFAHGEAVFARPLGREAAPVAVTWSGFPEAWLAAWSDPPNATVATLEDALILGGADWRRVTAQIGGESLSFYYRPANWRVSPETALPQLTRVLAANFEYWQDAPRPLFVPVLQLTGGEFGGRGLSNGFLIMAGADLDLRDFTRIFAHEHQHSWISRQVGGFPEQESNLSAWFNEGFAEALSARSLLRANMWTLEDFAADLNIALLRYGVSPEVEAPNRRIQEARSANQDVGRLPYDRGRLLAVHWDLRFRAHTSGASGLDAVLQTQRRMARENEARGVHVPANDLFPLAARETLGLDLSADMGRLVNDGARIDLSADLFAPCGRIESADQPIFERGFDLEASFRNGRRVTGLIPNGPAARAGLREGDRIRINEIWSRDSQTPLTYRVIAPDGSERTITYKPEGHARVRFQRFVLQPNMDARTREHCRQLLSGLR